MYLRLCIQIKTPSRFMKLIFVDRNSLTIGKRGATQNTQCHFCYVWLISPDMKIYASSNTRFPILYLPTFLHQVLPPWHSSSIPPPFSVDCWQLWWFMNYHYMWGYLFEEPRRPLHQLELPCEILLSDRRFKLLIPWWKQHAEVAFVCRCLLSAVYVRPFVI